MTASTPDRYPGEITVFKKSGGALTKRLELRGGEVINADVGSARPSRSGDRS
jgi:hypothetical protein